jgi:mono/diheme cytochrome c family protein
LATLLALTLLALGLVGGCQQKMAQQPSYQPDDRCDFFADKTSNRHEVAGTVARGHLHSDLALFTGRQSGSPPPLARLATVAGNREDAEARPLLEAEAAQFADFVDTFPIAINSEVVEHGRNRYLIYCVVCHDAAGTGLGKIVERGYTRPPSYHIERLRRAPVGYLYRVVTDGYGSMPSYAGQIGVRDRWAIVAYLRALQLSQHFPVEDLPEEMRGEWLESKKVAMARGGSP